METAVAKYDSRSGHPFRKNIYPRLAKPDAICYTATVTDVSVRVTGR